ncbi:unnamed protein product [Darwinula stevensoni]|uniref:Small ribosomal subunit protein mS39 n=1 Tax=Darwinula stevensoni TaxID=69355 RepID=A0A7R8X7L9_9CRUS|nr:unnamed protein product [Darwinula stevensoni]CAG0882465.1 unnamed protein product [Darwinula stevensoni]
MCLYLNPTVPYQRMLPETAGDVIISVRFYLGLLMTLTEITIITFVKCQLPSEWITKAHCVRLKFAVLYELLMRTSQVEQNGLAGQIQLTGCQFYTPDPYLGIAKWLAIYTSPITLLVLYRRGHFHSHEYMQERAVLILKACACAFCIGYFLRGVGRAMNSAYTEFYSDFIKSWNSRDKQRLFKTYDFEMSHWKTDFVSQARSTYKEPFSMNIFSALLAHTLGRCLMYPGSTSILNAIMQPHLTEARRQMLIEHGGERFYLGTPDGNKIDALLIDRRKRSPGHGPEYLIIGFEGNGGYYELGVLSTVLRKNYSILGWNHPGFGGSTGLPFPPQERNACNTVMDFAINVLGFPPENILLVAWSIGGFTATWAAMTQPNLKGLILDASFDHVMPLALGQFPGFLHPVIKSVIVNYFDLNNTAQLHRYQGPVLFYRRTNDEIICSVPGDLRTNRGNFLIYDFLQYRYPKIFDVAKEPIFFQWLNSDEGSRGLADCLTVTLNPSTGIPEKFTCISCNRPVYTWKTLRQLIALLCLKIGFSFLGTLPKTHLKYSIAQLVEAIRMRLEQGWLQGSDSWRHPWSPRGVVDGAGVYIQLLLHLEPKWYLRCPRRNHGGPTEEGNSGVKSLFGCGHPGCTEKSYVVECGRCTTRYCITHRNLEAHQCPLLDPPKEHMPKTKALIEGIIQQQKSQSTQARGHKSKSIAMKVALMKLKQQAEGPKDVPQDDRVYMRILLPNFLQTKESKPFFFSKHWPVTESNQMWIRIYHLAGKSAYHVAVLAGTIGKDYTAAHFKYHDDPYLIPASNISKRTFALAKESGRKAARWIRDHHQEFFQHKEAQPDIEAFHPRVTYDENSEMNVQLLTELVTQGDLGDAKFVYESLSKKGAELPESLKQSFLELICYYNEVEMPHEEDMEERWFTAVQQKKEVRIKSWRDGGLAEDVFASMKEKSSKAYCTLMRGMAKYYQAERAWNMYQEAAGKEVEIDVGTFNSLILITRSLKDSEELTWEVLMDLLHDMKRRGLQPNADTLNGILECLSTIGSWPLAKEKALATLSEFKHIGCEPSLASFYFLLLIFCRDRYPKNGILRDILKNLRGKTLTIQHPKDTYFFVTAMDVACNYLGDVALGKEIHEFLLDGNNYDFVGDSYKESIYYRNYFTLMCRNEPVDEFFEKTYYKFVPQIYTPEPSVLLARNFIELLSMIDMTGSAKYLPQLWSDMVVFDHITQQKLMEALLSVLYNNKPSTSDESKEAQWVREKFAIIISDLWERVEKIIKEKLYSSIQWTGTMVGNVIEVSVACGKPDLAWECMKKLQDDEINIPGLPSPDTLKVAFSAILETQNISRCLAIIRYAYNCSYLDESEAMAHELKNSVPLDMGQRMKINNLFGKKIIPGPEEDESTGAAEERNR